jgi:hypothetical protein
MTKADLMQSHLRGGQFFVVKNSYHIGKLPFGEILILAPILTLTMKPELDAALSAAFGSETRLRVLAVLSNAYRPLTGYRIAKTGDVPIPKAHEQLHRLERSGLVAHLVDGWIIQDRDVRALLRKRIRIRAWNDWLTEKAEKEPRVAALFDRLSKAPHAEAPKGWKPRDPKRFHRDPRKDLILGRMGLSRSIHGR